MAGAIGWGNLIIKVPGKPWINPEFNVVARHSPGFSPGFSYRRIREITYAGVSQLIARGQGLVAMLPPLSRRERLVGVFLGGAEDRAD